jgi:cation diffusion facilitator CzcD-associated flavoprotein CzcO
VNVDAEIVIVGAGFGGLGMAIALKRHGFDSLLILERGDDVGGTWRDNVYPGCACDIPSALYSFSFEPNPWWSRVYPPQAELWDYLRRCATKYGLLPHLRFRTELREARYDERAAIWRLSTSDGRSFSARVLICALGALSRPKVPTFSGIERFSGTALHSAQWNAGVGVGDRRVALIGTGASGVQIVPAIAPLVRQLYVFQRTPPWIVPRGDNAIPPWQRTLRRYVPGYARAARTRTYWLLELRALGFTLVPDLMRGPEKLALRHLAKQIPDRALRRRLTPSYRMGCKRVLLSDDYYPSLLRANVKLVTDSIAEFRERSIVDSRGVERDLDVAIFATGFRATEGLVPVRFFGRNGTELAQAWRDGMKAYLGLSVAGFPNLFTIVGPNTGLGHNSMVVMMEAQYRYVLGAMQLMRRHHIRAIDVLPEVQTRFNARLQDRMARTVWATGCSSWYQDAGGRNTALWPGFTFTYRQLTRRFRAERYEMISPA